MSQSVCLAEAWKRFPQKKITPAEGLTLEHVKALYEFLQGKPVKGVYIKPAPKLSSRRAFDVIYFLQEYLGIIPDIFDRCCSCGDMYNSEAEGTYYRNSHYCDGCRPD